MLAEPSFLTQMLKTPRVAFTAKSKGLESFPPQNRVKPITIGPSTSGWIQSKMSHNIPVYVSTFGFDPSQIKLVCNVLLSFDLG